ncbi:MAG: DUF1800 family protein [Planctomycetota bacterium]
MHEERGPAPAESPEARPQDPANGEFANSEFAGLARRLAARLPRPDGAVTKAAAGAAFAAFFARSASASSTGSSTTPVPTSFDPLLVRLVNRVCGGFQLEQYHAAVNAGSHQAYLDQQLAYTPSGDAALQATLQQWPVLDQLNGITSSPPADIPTLAALNHQPLNWARFLQSQTMVRRICTAGPLFERMVELWSDHLNISAFDKAIGLLKAVEDRDAIRAHALGDFGAMLHANALSAAMLIYLDNWTNSKPTYQENYARELLELHTLGVNNGYTENDIKAVAACFAGHTFDFGTLGASYNGSFHDDAPSYLLLTSSGTSIPVPSGGIGQATTVLDGLIVHPNTKEYVAGKLTRWLVGYEPSSTALGDVLGAWGTTGDIQAMTNAALSPQTIADVEQSGVLKLKRPSELAVNLLRALGATLSGPTMGDPVLALVDELTELGNAPHAWSPPNGYPDSEGAWSAGVLGRWRLVRKLMFNELTGITIDSADLLAPLLPLWPGQVSEMPRQISRVLTGDTLTTSEMTVVQIFFDQLTPVALTPGSGYTPDDLVRDTYALVASAPSYQYH